MAREKPLQILTTFPTKLAKSAKINNMKEYRTKERHDADAYRAKDSAAGKNPKYSLKTKGETENRSMATDAKGKTHERSDTPLKASIRPYLTAQYAHIQPKTQNTAATKYINK